MRRYIFYIIFFLLGLAFTAFVYAQGSPSQKWVNAIESYFNGTNYVNVSSTNPLPVGIQSGTNTIGAVNQGTNPWNTSIVNSTSCALNASGQGCYFSTNGANTIFIAVSGTWSATLQPEGLGYNTGESSKGAVIYQINTSGQIINFVSSITTNGLYAVPLQGSSNIIVNVSSYTSGTADVYMYAASNAMTTLLPPPENANFTVQSGLVNVTSTAQAILTAGAPGFLNILSLSCYNSGSSSDVVVELENNLTLTVAFSQIAPPGSGFSTSWTYPGLPNSTEGYGWSVVQPANASGIYCSAEGVYVLP